MIDGSVALVKVFDRKFRQPLFTPDRPELIGRDELIRGIHRAQMKLDLVIAA